MTILQLSLVLLFKLNKLLLDSESLEDFLKCYYLNETTGQCSFLLQYIMLLNNVIRLLAM